MTDNSNHDDVVVEPSSSLVQRPMQNTALSPTYGPYLQTLPPTRRLPKDSIAEADAIEGVHPTAAERVNSDPRKSLYEILVLSASVAIFLGLLYLAFPWKYFLKPSAYDMSIGPQIVRLTDEDVQKNGGIDKLSTVQLAVYQVTQLRDKGQFIAARNKCSEYIGMIQSDTEHATWIPIWRNYFDLLDQLKQTDDLLEQCNRLKKLMPDSPEAVYYPAKIAIDSIPRRSSYKKDDERKYRETLTAKLKECQVAEAALLGRKDDPASQTMLDGFRLLIADAYRRQWWLSEFSWKDGSGEQAFEYIRKLPPDSKQAMKMKLSILYDCRDNWSGFWRNDPSQRLIDARTINEDNLREEIRRLESI